MESTQRQAHKFHEHFENSYYSVFFSSLLFSFFSFFLSLLLLSARAPPIIFVENYFSAIKMLINSFLTAGGQAHSPPNSSPPNPKSASSNLCLYLLSTDFHFNSSFHIPPMVCAHCFEIFKLLPFFSAFLKTFLPFYSWHSSGPFYILSR